MTHPNASTALARVVVDELVRHGVGLAVLSPGSRSGALAIAAAEHPGLETRVVIDERSAAFHALGAARASWSPVAVMSTSGSAPAHFYPAIVEADMSCVPLVVISADRPAELQGIGANQTIDQIGMFGTKVRGHAGIEAPDSSTDQNETWRATVSGLLTLALQRSPGPVHLNVRFREPTVPVTDDGRTSGIVYPFETPRIDIGSNPGPETVSMMPELSGARGVIVAGDGEYDRDELAERSAEKGWPVLATALSGMRGGEVVSSYHHMLAGGLPSGLRPDVVVAVGATGPSSRLETLFAAAEQRIRIDRWGRTIDPGRNATQIVAGDVNMLLAGQGTPAGRGWLQAWNDADLETRKHIDEVLESCDRMSGALTAASLNDVEWGSLVVASSLPIREVDAMLHRKGHVFANRGASGIDGFVSTALGVASRHHRVLALSGDLSLIHDSNGFLHDGDIALTIVVMDNEGGGLFDSLPQAAHAPHYERLFVTRPERDLEDLARFHHLRYDVANDPGSLRSLAAESLDRSGVDLIRVPIDRGYDLEVRAHLDG